MANNWTDKETKLLLSLWSGEKIQEQLYNHSFRNKVINEKIANEMAQKGVKRNCKQIEYKLKNLKEKYRIF